MGDYGALLHNDSVGVYQELRLLSSERNMCTQACIIKINGRKWNKITG